MVPVGTVRYCTYRSLNRGKRGIRGRIPYNRFSRNGQNYINGVAEEKACVNVVDWDGAFPAI